MSDTESTIPPIPAVSDSDAPSTSKRKRKPKVEIKSPRQKAREKEAGKPRAKRAPKGEHKPTKEIILGLLGRRELTIAEMCETGKLDHISKSGVIEAVKRLYGEGALVVTEQHRTGLAGRPAWRYKAA